MREYNCFFGLLAFKLRRNRGGAQPCGKDEIRNVETIMVAFKNKDVAAVKNCFALKVAGDRGS